MVKFNRVLENIVPQTLEDGKVLTEIDIANDIVTTVQQKLGESKANSHAVFNGLLQAAQDKVKSLELGTKDIDNSMQRSR